MAKSDEAQRGAAGERPLALAPDWYIIGHLAPLTFTSQTWIKILLPLLISLLGHLTTHNDDNPNSDSITPNSLLAEKAVGFLY